MGKFSQWFYNSMYRFTKPDWDTGVTPPEVTAVLATFKQSGRALDLGVVLVRMQAIWLNMAGK